MREYIRIGINGIIPGKPPSAFDADSVAKLRAIIDEGEFQSKVRLAGRSENPFTRPDTAYALTRHGQFGQRVPVQRSIGLAVDTLADLLEILKFMPT
jgi:hypothetical protein